MQRNFNFFYAFLLALLGLGVTLMAEEITLTTYYPAPYGAYDELSVNNKIAFPTVFSQIVAELPWTTSVETQGNVRIAINTDDVPNDWFKVTHGSAKSVIFSIYGTDGKVGIGVDPAAYKLDVAGDINTTGEVRKNGTAYNNPDYVFEPGYKVMNIAETKNFVFENKHLPNMPSSEEIKTDGVKIFEQNRLLLEKLEEAYLHIFQLEERITKLERR